MCVCIPPPPTHLGLPAHKPVHSDNQDTQVNFRQNQCKSTSLKEKGSPVHRDKYCLQNNPSYLCLLYGKYCQHSTPVNTQEYPTSHSDLQRASASILPAQLYYTGSLLKGHMDSLCREVKPHSPSLFLQVVRDRVKERVRDTHRFISADGVYLGPKHNWGEDEKQKSLKTQEDEENHCGWWREGTALCEDKTTELEGQTLSNAPAAKHLLSHEFSILKLSKKLYEQHSQKDTLGSSDMQA